MSSDRLIHTSCLRPPLLAQTAPSVSVRVFVAQCVERVLLVEPRPHALALLPVLLRVAAAVSARSKSATVAEAPLQRQIGMTLANLLPVVFQLVAGAFERNSFCLPAFCCKSALFTLA